MTIPMWQVAEKIAPTWQRFWTYPIGPGAMAKHPGFAPRGRCQETVASPSIVSTNRPLSDGASDPGGGL
jgi:hypothetical protein